MLKASLPHPQSIDPVTRNDIIRELERLVRAARADRTIPPGTRIPARLARHREACLEAALDLIQGMS